MKPAPFRYHAPDSLAEALDLLSRFGDEAKPLAGGQSLVPAMNFRLAQPSVLVDLNRIDELAYVAEQPDELRVGAMTRQRTVEQHAAVKTNAPLLHAAMPYIAHPQIRNRGTLGGSLAHADPASELPAVAMALDASFELRNRERSRLVPVRDFYVGLFETAAGPDELVTEVRFPRLGDNWGWGFAETSRRHGDYALVGVAAAVQLGENGNCQEARIALFSVGEGPVSATRACDSLLGERLDPDSIRNAAALAGDQDIEPPSDIHATSAFRRHLARALTKKVLHQALARAQPTKGDRP